MRENIIGRYEEQRELEEVLHSNKSEFVAVCGRRRVGKTFLIEEFFEKEIVFKTAGMADQPKTMQIKAFYRDLLDSGIDESEEQPKDWLDIFSLLRKLITAKGEGRKVVVLDELPWMDTPKSGFVPALEHFWNVWASSRRDVVLVVCGSSTSWMMNTLFRNHGGLYNRITHRLFLQPFTLNETEQLLRSRNIALSRYETAELYMIMGGIPFYLEMLQQRMSLAQNIDNLFFRRNGTLRREFGNLYAALFRNSGDYVKIVRALSKNLTGLTREEILSVTKLPSGGGLSSMLDNLESCGFIRVYKNYLGHRGELKLYQLVDFYTLFYFHFIEGKEESAEERWSDIQGKPEFYAWAGLSFETLALHHIPQMKRALGIGGVKTEEYAFRLADESGGAQIDLLIDRADNTVNLCEMKYSIDRFTIDKDYEMNLRRKISLLSRQPRFRKSVRLTFVTTFGVERNIHSGMVCDEVTLDDLFA